MFKEFESAWDFCKEKAQICKQSYIDDEIFIDIVEDYNKKTITVGDFQWKVTQRKLLK